MAVAASTLAAGRGADGADGVFAGQWPRFVLRLSQSVADANLPRWVHTGEAQPTPEQAAELWRRYREALPQLDDAAAYTMAAFINASFPPSVQLRVDAATLAQQWPSVWHAFFRTMVRNARDKQYWTLYGRDKAAWAADALRRALRRVLKFVAVVRGDDEAPLAAVLADTDDVPPFREVDIEVEPAFVGGAPAGASPEPGAGGEAPAPTVKPPEQLPRRVKYAKAPPESRSRARSADGSAVDWSQLKRA